MTETSDILLHLILDTSVFTNPHSSAQFGPEPGVIFETFLDLVEAVLPRARLYMPPLVHEELRAFYSGSAPPPRFEALVCLKAPNRYAAAVPGFLLYELIDDIRARIDRGLRVAEKAVRDAQEDIGRSITRLRERYREALRSGLIDSREDVDLILLAMELQGAVVSSDDGVVRWAERMGVRLVHSEELRGVLEGLLPKAPVSR